MHSCVPRGAAGPRAAKHTAWPGWQLLGAVAAGGAVGALLRHLESAAWPSAPGAFPWATFAINVAGCFLMGLLKPALGRMGAAQRWVNTTIGTGVLGGYTTFSHYMADFVHLVLHGRVDLAFAYLVGTILAVLLAVATGVVFMKSLLALTTGR